MKKNFENQWKDALSDASHTPPPEIWDRIEADLDKNKKRGIFWLNPFLLSGVAAAIMLVLATLFLFKNAQTPVAKSIEKSAQPTNESQSLKPSISNEPVELNQEISAQEKIPSENNHLIAKSTLKEKVAKGSSFTDNKQIQSDLVAATIETPQSKDSESPITQINKLASLAYLEMGNSFQGFRNKLEVLRDDTPIQTKKNRESWFGVLAFNAPFNPNFSTPQFQTQALSAAQNSAGLNAFDKGVNGTSGMPNGNYYSSSSRTDVYDSYKRGRAMSFGVSFGKRLKNRLSLETGVRYTKASATHQSNVYSLNKTTGKYESFTLSNYVLPENGNNDVIVSVNGTSQHDYNFVSIPILLNYNIINAGRFNVNAVGGLSSELLISGNVVNSKYSETSFNASNSRFRAVNLAGVTGLRLSYALTNLLDINLGSTYQHFLTSGIESSQDASFKPSMFGMNLGLSVRK